MRQFFSNARKCYITVASGSLPSSSRTTLTRIAVTMTVIYKNLKVSQLLANYQDLNYAEQ